MMDTGGPNTDKPSSRRVFTGSSRKVLCRTVTGIDCDRVMDEDAENCGIRSHVRTVLVGSPRGDADHRTRSSMYRRQIIVDEDYELVLDESHDAVELDETTFDPGDLWVSVRVQREFTGYHACDAEEAIRNVRLVVRKGLDEGRYERKKWGGHFFWWRGYSVTVNPSLDVAISYRTNHYERTPQQVADGVKSRLSKRGRVRRERVFPDSIAVGDVIDGVVSSVVKFGAFIQITDDFDALLHNSDLGDHAESAVDAFEPGEHLRVEVTRVDIESGKVNVRFIESDGEPPAASCGS